MIQSQGQMRIKEFSEVTGWSIDTIRFYEEKGLLHPQRDEASRYRSFSKEDLEVAEGIRVGRALGFSLAEIRVGLDANRTGDLTTELKLQIIREKLTQVRAKIDHLQEIGHYLEAKHQWIENGEIGTAPVAPSWSDT